MFKNILSVVFFFFFLMGTATANPSSWLAPCPDGNGNCLWYNCKDGSQMGECTDAQLVTAAPAVVRQPTTMPAPAPEAKAEAKPAPETPSNPWPYIVGLGIFAATVLGILYFRRLARIECENEAARQAQERRRERARLDDELRRAGAALARKPGNQDNKDRVIEAEVALHRHLHPDEPVTNDCRVTVSVAPSAGHIPAVDPVA